jgi:hypothetical protein
MIIKNDFKVYINLFFLFYLKNKIKMQIHKLLHFGQLKGIKLNEFNKQLLNIKKLDVPQNLRNIIDALIFSQRHSLLIKLCQCNKILYNWYKKWIYPILKIIRIVWIAPRIQFWFRCQLLKKESPNQYIFGEGSININLYNSYMHNLKSTNSKLHMIEYAVLNRAPVLCSFFMIPNELKFRISNLTWIMNIITHPIIYDMLPDKIKKDEYLGPIYARLHMKIDGSTTINDYPIEIRHLI